MHTGYQGVLVFRSDHHIQLLICWKIFLHSSNKINCFQPPPPIKIVTPPSPKALTAIIDVNLNGNRIVFVMHGEIEVHHFILLLHCMHIYIHQLQHSRLYILKCNGYWSMIKPAFKKGVELKISCTQSCAPNCLNGAVSFIGISVEFLLCIINSSHIFRPTFFKLCSYYGHNEDMHMTFWKCLDTFQNI
jgi:hypothetical protein